MPTEIHIGPSLSIGDSSVIVVACTYIRVGIRSSRALIKTLIEYHLRGRERERERVISFIQRVQYKFG